MKNFSASKIKILGIENGCGCTTGNVSDSIIKISDSVRIQVLYIPLITKDSGMVEKYITIRTDANPPFRNIIIKGEVHK